MKPNLFIPELNISSLITAEGINKFKAEFSRQSVEFDKMIDVVSILKLPFNSKITIINNNGDEAEYEYFQDYFRVAINRIPDNFYKKLKVEGKKIYSDNARINFYKTKQIEVLKTLNYYSGCNHINSTEKDEIKNQLEVISDKLNKRILGLSDVANDKITFNIDKGEVLYLLKLLLELKIITGISIYELMKFAEKHFNYSKHTKISSANKSLSTYISRLETKRGNKLSYTDTDLLNFFKGVLDI